MIPGMDWLIGISSDVVVRKVRAFLDVRLDVRLRGQGGEEGTRLPSPTTTINNNNVNPEFGMMIDDTPEMEMKA